MLSLWQIILRMALAMAIIAGVLFGSAGRLDLPMFWVYLAAFLSFGVITMTVMSRHNPDLLRERLKPGPGKRERIARPLLILLIVVHWVLAGIDVGRYHWSDRVPLEAQLAGTVVMVLGMFGWAWAMYVNSFFSSEVRIQTDRGHHVIDRGPYRFVRHPGYLSALILFLGATLVLGSYVSLIPMVGALAVFVWRTSFEDRVLRNELTGYADYASRVRYRLVPGIW